MDVWRQGLGLHLTSAIKTTWCVSMGEREKKMASQRREELWPLEKAYRFKRSRPDSGTLNY